MIIAHIINPVKVSEDNKSYLYYTQPITFESMFKSKLYTEKNNKIEVNLYTINYQEDNSIIPNYFIKLPDLIKSTKDLYPTISKKKLPFLQDIFNNILKYVEADYYIYTNTDIIISENFYEFIFKQIKRFNYDTIIVNRRDNIPKYINNIQLNKEHLNIISSIYGERHMGKDCFIIKNSILKKINMRDMFVAYPPWGKILGNYLRAVSNNYKVFGGEYYTYHLGNDNNHGNSDKQDPMTQQNYINAKVVETQFNLII